MGFSVDHSQNFPREFHICNHCNKKGVYVVVRGKPENLILMRCRYCGRAKEIEREYWLGLENELKFF